ncbi:MAG: alanine/glycine:cation symporter family protein [Eubacteriales bacterium]
MAEGLQKFLATVETVNGEINTFVWVTLGLTLLLFTGVLTTVITKCFQVTHFKHWIKNTIGSVFKKHVSGHTGDKGSISQFQALCTALAATVGVGNIAGVATAIVSGGPGAIFWMWVAAFLGMMTNYSENVLGIFYRRKNPKGEWSGGAMYYLQDGLGSYKGCKTIGKVLAVLFACFAVLASFGIGNASQINTIASNMKSAFHIPMWVSGIVLLVLAGLVIIGGIKRIAAVAEKIVPFMVILYIVGALIIIITNAGKILPAFGAIFQFAFGVKAVGGAALGIAVKNAVVWGCKRGVFSNEAGLGSSVMVHSTSNVKEPVKQGMWGIFEVFADTIIVCTLTALVVLTSGLVNLDTGAMQTQADKSTLVAEAFGGVFGAAGSSFIAIAILLFAFTTVLGWSYYGTKAWEYLFGTKATVGYKTVFVLFIMLGATMSLDLAWDISDTFNALMLVPNLIGVIALCPVVVKITRNYTRRTFKGEKITPMYNANPEIQKAEEEDTTRN